MEGIVIFIIFIVFSVLRSLGESQQKQQQRGRGPASPPVRPVRPGRPVAPNPRPYDMPAGYDDFVLERESAPKEEREPQKAPTLRKQVKLERPTLAADKHYAIRQQVSGMSLKMNQESLVQGIIFSEVLGAPRAKKPWRPRS